ncbi:SIMPL domain-containing protein [Aestuariirhabdus sp. Z084]|uniref:SIMPL domain-containing protein n=1 Tax=Aestuariirhabdus haliotis TaxID=2918751 RepID=UPI00201B37C4|nr:SIMPL domain-containing protein [Aestuariirhabdus haliotis]MCL6417585.1 SIMPL domain-containing protein [Aestuariirhabdus haliotis]MCL6421511.1 SIMPL domain-containing protein [Aestuariirhabdus haliotis]
MTHETNRPNSMPALLLALGIMIGFGLLGLQIASSVISFKEYERTVTVKGLSEREVDADTVIWPIGFTAASNDLTQIYARLENSKQNIDAFLQAKGIPADAISVTPPAVTDKSAQQYGGGPAAQFRYTAQQSVTVYSHDVAQVRQVMGSLSELGKQGIVISGADYLNQTEYLFTGLNTLKPQMVQEATETARQVGEKFAQDSGSRLGKIKRAVQGQFSISPRDRNNPHIKKIRVVSTIEYYLAD